MANDAKAELYRFVKDRYDKFLTARAMAQTRLGHFLVVVGFLITGLMTVGFPQLATVFDYAKGYSRILAYVTAAAFVVTLVFLGLLLAQLLKALARFHFAIPQAKGENILGCIDYPNLDPVFVYKSLTNQYLLAIADIEVEAGHVGKHFRRALKLNKWAMIFGVAFIVCLLSARICVSPPPSTANQSGEVTKNARRN